MPNCFQDFFRKIVGGKANNNSDGTNVALHEMAHALHHENFIQEAGIDWDFRQDFDQLPSIYGPVMTNAIIKEEAVCVAMLS